MIENSNIRVSTVQWHAHDHVARHVGGLTQVINGATGHLRSNLKQNGCSINQIMQWGLHDHVAGRVAPLATQGSHIQKVPSLKRVS
jgi:hypothetical protein